MCVHSVCKPRPDKSWLPIRFTCVHTGAFSPLTVGLWPHTSSLDILVWFMSSMSLHHLPHHPSHDPNYEPESLSGPRPCCIPSRVLKKNHDDFNNFNNCFNYFSYFMRVVKWNLMKPMGTGNCWNEMNWNVPFSWNFHDGSLEEIQALWNVCLFSAE